MGAALKRRAMEITEGRNPRDCAASFRVMQLMDGGVGSGSAAQMLDHIIAAVDPIAPHTDAPAPPRAGNTWDGFVERAQSLPTGRSG